MSSWDWEPSAKARIEGHGVVNDLVAEYKRLTTLPAPTTEQQNKAVRIHEMIKRTVDLAGTEGQARDGLIEMGRPEGDGLHQELDEMLVAARRLLD
jgi:hypothetical protein